MAILGGGRSPSILNPVILATSGSPHTGDTTAFVGWYLNVPGGSLGPNGWLHIESLWDTTAGGAPGSLTAAVRIMTGTVAGSTSSGTQFASSTAIGTIPGRWRGNWIISNLGAENSQTMMSNANIAAGSNGGALSIATVNTANDFTISGNGTLGNAGDAAFVRYVQALAYYRA